MPRHAYHGRALRANMGPLRSSTGLGFHEVVLQMVLDRPVNVPNLLVVAILAKGVYR